MVGRRNHSTDGFLVSAATLSLLSTAAQQQPVLVLIDDLQWIDPESLTVLLFAARRIGHDAVAILMARRDASTEPELAGIKQYRLSGLSADQSAALLSKGTGPRPPSSSASCTRPPETRWPSSKRSANFTPEQLRGSAPLPTVLPVGERLSNAFLDHQRTLARGAPRVAIAAAAMDQQAGPVVAALRAEGIDADAALSEAEQSER